MTFTAGELVETSLLPALELTCGLQGYNKVSGTLGPALCFKTVLCDTIFPGRKWEEKAERQINRLP